MTSPMGLTPPVQKSNTRHDSDLRLPMSQICNTLYSQHQFPQYISVTCSTLQINIFKEELVLKFCVPSLFIHSNQAYTSNPK